MSRGDGARKRRRVRFAAVLGTVARLLCLFDRLFPPARVGGRESGESYSSWEYETGRTLLTDYAVHFGSLGGRAVLDVGCGLGGKTVAYAEAGARVVGIDIERANVAQSACYARARGADLSLIVGDAGMLPFPDRCFDLVVANDSMEHFARPEAAFREMTRVLRPGGMIYLFFTPWHSPLGSHLYDYIRTPWCHLLFSERLLREMLRLILERRGVRDPAAAADALIEAYRTELNRMTVRRYRRIVGASASIEVVAEEFKPPKFAVLAPLTALPWVGELFTGTVVSFLRKRVHDPDRPEPPRSPAGAAPHSP
jgi:ubiquinone/menaquinone biosynthesis C-methylase UbiE